jgi:hypothetical protein
MINKTREPQNIGKNQGNSIDPNIKTNIIRNYHIEWELKRLEGPNLHGYISSIFYEHEPIKITKLDASIEAGSFFFSPSYS